MLLETMFPGFGLGVSVLCHEGKILQAFEHHRANELNGSSYYRKSAPLHPDRLAAVERMVSACGYTGLAMFEFKASPADGKWILIEVNARPWGSLPLPVSLGVDFPYRLYRLSVHNEPTASIDYPVGHYCRNLIQDIWQTRSAASGLIRQPVRLGLHCLGWLWSFHRALLGREHYDTLVLDDPRPGLRELFADRWGSRGRKKGGRPLGGAQLISHLDRLVHERSGRNIEVLFVCQGNINRSSYAELKAKQLFGSSLFRFSSAGMLPRNRRGSPAVAISAAACHGVDMSAHRSRHASAAVLNAADVILVFDEINLKSIAARYPELDKPVYLIGEVISSADPQILDPEGKSEATFFSTYRRIDECLTVLERSVQTHGELMQEGAKC
jgi:protein-tyrosine-phosphatase